MALTCAELVEHPAFEDVIHNLPPTKKGTSAVATGRGGPFNISYEIHGTGPIHLVVSRPSSSHQGYAFVSRLASALHFRISDRGFRLLKFRNSGLWG